jgi:hypothetical protein
MPGARCTPKGAGKISLKPKEIFSSVIPGRATREPGIHNHDRKYGFRARAKRRIPE